MNEYVCLSLLTKFIINVCAFCVKMHIKKVTFICNVVETGGSVFPKSNLWTSANILVLKFCDVLVLLILSYLIIQITWNPSEMNENNNKQQWRRMKNIFLSYGLLCKYFQRFILNEILYKYAYCCMCTIFFSHTELMKLKLLIN